MYALASASVRKTIAVEYANIVFAVSVYIGPTYPVTGAVSVGAAL